MKRFTMIARHGVSGGAKSEALSYTLIGQDYLSVNVDSNLLKSKLETGSIEVTNLGVGKNGIISTNGAMDKYTFINERGEIEGKARAVILDRAEADGKLIGYTVFTPNGQIKEMSVAEATSLAINGLLSNGKVRHTDKGDIVSSIGGNYPLRTIEIAKAPKGELTVEVMFMAATIKGSESVKYAGAIINGTSAVVMSEIKSLVEKGNREAYEKALKLDTEAKEDSFALKRLGANSIYGIVKFSDLTKIAGKASNVKAKEQLLVSVIDCTNGKEETVIKIENGKASAVNVTSENSKNFALKYAKKAMEELKL